MPSSSQLALLSQEIQDRQIQTLPTRKGLLAIGLQNEFTSHDGKLPVSLPEGFWPGLQSLIPAFREFGDVVWVRTEFDGTPEDSGIIGSSGKVEYDEQCENDEDHENEDVGERDSPVPAKRQRKSSDESDSTPTLDAIERALTPGSSASKPPQTGADEEFFLSQPLGREACCLRDSSGAQLCTDAASLVNKDRDLQTITKSYSAFDTGTLLTSLRSNLVTELYICGCPTNSSVYATAMDAARYGFEINLIEDCLAARTTKLNDTTIAQLCDVLEAEAVTSAEALELLRNPFPEDDVEYESDGQSEYDEEVVEGDAGGLRGGGAILIADDDSSVSTQFLGDTGGNASPVLVSAGPLSSHLDDGLQEFHFSPIDAYKSFETEVGCQEQAPHIPKLDGRDGYAQGVKTGEEEHSQSPKDQCERENNGPGGTQGLADLENALTPDGFAFHESLEEPDVRQFKQPPTGSSKHPGLNALSSICRLHQKTVDQYEDMMKQARIPQQQPLFGEGKEVESNGSTILHGLLPSDVAEIVFDSLKDEITWQRMYHQTGEVPRLVSCQGNIEADGSRPVYRHPSDRTLPSEPWTPMVDRIRKAAEEQVGHTLNHALIQFYRSGTDYISEHSDKTLDIAKGTCIVNVSFGAQRTMRLRTKRPPGTDPTRAPPERTTYRVPMPHNSMIRMTLETNAEYLHGINANNRPAVELSPAEQAYAGGRISLTFRNIGTFLDADSSHIWGQGATGKARDCAGPVINGDVAESERLVKAFGVENQATQLQWDATYGGGSDVLHLKSVAVIEPSTS